MRCSLLPGHMTRQGLMMLVLVLLTGGVLVPAVAQTDEVRVARSLQSAAGDVRVHVVIPRGQAIESAALEVNTTTTPLDVAPVELPITRWLLLDASDTMINTAPAVSDALERLLLNNPGDDVRTGAIRFNQRLDVLQPTDSTALVQDWLDGYAAQAGTLGCLSDALARLQAQELAPDRLHRVLIITGGLTRQGLCAEEGYIETGVPLDVLVIADSVDDFYRDITERSNGELYQANLQSIRPRLTEVRAQWARPAFELAGMAPAADEAGLQIVLSSGRSIEQAITLERQAAPESETVVGAGLQTIPTSTPPPTDTPPPSATAQNPTAVTDESATPVTGAVAADTTETSPATATETTADNPAASGASTDNPTATPDTDSTAPTAVAAAATAVPAATDAPATPPDDSAAPADDSNSSQMLLLGGGVAAVLVVLMVIIFLLRGRSNQQEATDPMKDIEHTLVDLEATQVELDDEDELSESAVRDNFYDRPGLSDDDDDFDLTEMLDDDEDEFDKTEIVSPEDMLAAANQTLVGELRVPDSDVSYPIQAPATLLGRADDCDIVITGDSQISRQHVRFSVDDSGQVVIHPLTANPVLLDGDLLEDSQPLHDGNQLQLSLTLSVTYHRLAEDTPDSEDTV